MIGARGGKLLRERHGVQHFSLALSHVLHVQRDRYRQSEFPGLGKEIQASPQIGGVGHEQKGIRTRESLGRSEHDIQRDSGFRSVRSQGVGTGEIHKFHFALFEARGAREGPAFLPGAQATSCMFSA